MPFASLDLIIFVGFFVVVVSLSIWKSRRAKDHPESSSDFFLAGRGLTWPLIGISIVAANISTEQMVGMRRSEACRVFRRCRHSKAAQVGKPAIRQVENLRYEAVHGKPPRSRNCASGA